MEQQQPITELRARARSLGVPILIGFFLIVYAAFGVVWFQQQREQDKVEGNIAQLRPIVSQPVVISEELQAGYNEAQQSIPGELTVKDIFRVVLDVAENSGFDTTIDVSKTGDVSANRVLSVTAAPVKAVNVGGSSYRVVPLSINVTGGYSEVLELIASLEAQQDLKTLVLENLTINETEQGATAVLDFSVYIRTQKG